MIRRIFKGATVTTAIALLAFAGSTTSIAASKVEVDLPNSSVVGGESTPLPILLTGFTYDKITVTLVSEAGNLTVADPDGKLTLNPGYTSLADQLEIAFNGTTADVVSILETGVTWTAPGDATTKTTLALRVQVGEFQEGTSYDPATGHTYKFITDALSWVDAREAAKLMTYKGKSGYLANITTSEENDFIATKSGADDVWFGGTDDLGYVNDALTLAGKPTVAGPTQTTGEYYWGSGDEAGIMFTTGLDNPVAVGDAFNGWAPNEPNNWSNSEGCAVTNWGGDKGKWNDLNCSNTNSYIVEFSTTQDQFAAAVVTFDNITGDDKDAVPAETPTEKLADTGYNPWLLLSVAVLLVAAGVSVRVASRRR